MISRLYGCAPAYEQWLIDELRRVYPGARHGAVAPGWIESQLSPIQASQVRAMAFAQQCVPRPERLEAASINAWARTLGEWLASALGDAGAPWRMHLYCHDIPGAALRARRVALIETELGAWLHKKRRQLERTRNIDMAAPWQPEEILVQAIFITPESAFVSVCLPEERHILRRVISRFPGGHIEIPPDKAPPSRAFAKLVEAQAHWGRDIQPGETCVDLGSAPGGWAYVALERGAWVTAVDRSPLREDLMGHPRLCFVTGDGFKWKPDMPPGKQPNMPIDWLLCDIIAFPERSIALLEDWLSRRLCKQFVVTIKFRGSDDYPELEKCKDVLERAGAEYCLRHLNSNKNEVTAYGCLPATAISP